MSKIVTINTNPKSIVTLANLYIVHVYISDNGSTSGFNPFCTERPAQGL